MSGLCIATNYVSNDSTYQFSYPVYSLSSGNWQTSPQPIPSDAQSLLAFQAVGVNGTATGSVGTVTYGCYLPGATQPSGTTTFNFSDPFSGSGSCSSSTTVPNLSVNQTMGPTGDSDYALTFTWTVSTQITNGMIVQVSGAEAQYLILMGQACQLPDSTTITNLFTSAAAGNVIPILQSQLNAIPGGPPVTSGATLVQNGAQVCLSSWGQLCWIVSPQVFGEYGFNWDNIQPAPAQLPPQGLDITS
ncbi:MAG: hypothetical protein ACJ76Y_12470 [Thermoanaerobaculia bacterium]